MQTRLCYLLNMITTTKWKGKLQNGVLLKRVFGSLFLSLFLHQHNIVAHFVVERGDLYCTLHFYPPIKETLGRSYQQIMNALLMLQPEHSK